MSVKKCTIVFPVREDKIILALKKHKVGNGLYNGWGGKEKPEDQGDMARVALREFQEESGAVGRADSLQLAAIIHFFEDGQPTYECYVYFLYEWEGTILETSEMGPPKEYPFFDPPYNQMMAADRQWLSLICSGYHIEGYCYYSKGNRAVERFEYGPLK